MITTTAIHCSMPFKDFEDFVRFGSAFRPSKASVTQDAACQRSHTTRDASNYAKLLARGPTQQVTYYKKKFSASTYRFLTPGPTFKLFKSPQRRPQPLSFRNGRCRSNSTFAMLFPDASPRGAISRVHGAADERVDGTK